MSSEDEDERRLQNVFKTYFQDVFLKTFWRCLEDLLKTSWKMKNYYAEDVFFKTYWKTKNVGWVSRMIFFSKINQIKTKMKVSCADHIPICSSKTIWFKFYWNIKTLSYLLMEQLFEDHSMRRCKNYLQVNNLYADGTTIEKWSADGRIICILKIFWSWIK